MTYLELKKFITQDMSMAHIYQPVMLIELLKNKGCLTKYWDKNNIMKIHYQSKEILFPIIKIDNLYQLV